MRDEQPQDTMQYYDVVFLVDDSGSMEDNDPDNVRATAVYNFIRSLAASDGFQVTTFTDSTSEKVEYTTNIQSRLKRRHGYKRRDKTGNIHFGRDRERHSEDDSHAHRR